MPWGVQYPVNFSPSGDTTSQAFQKHIQEIKKIYDYLNILNSSKLDASSLSSSLSGVNSNLTAHINSSTPHPNWKPTLSSLTGNLDISRITGNLDISRITGNLPISRITGNLDVSRIDGLTSFVNSKIPASSGDGITSSSLSSNGYAKFNNGLMLQWGVVQDSSSTPNYFAFHTPFTSSCYAVNIQTRIPSWANLSAKSYVGNSGTGNPNVNEHEVYITLCDWDKNGFVATVTTKNGTMAIFDTPVVYIAIGK